MEDSSQSSLPISDSTKKVKSDSSIPHSDQKELSQHKPSKVDRDSTSSTFKKSPENCSGLETSKSKTGTTQAMLDRWIQSKVQDQPFHAIDVYSLMESDAGAAEAHRGSSPDYFDPNVETEGTEDSKNPKV